MAGTATPDRANECFERLLAERQRRSPGSDRARLRACFEQVRTLYADRTHWTGESLLDHCLGVLESFSAFDPDDDSVLACLLHHALDAKLWTIPMLEERYGSTVRTIVSGVHLLSHVTMENRRMSLEHLRLMFLRVSDDMRVVLLILCDQERHLSRLAALESEMQRTLCRDVLHLFAPVAARLGMYSLKHSLEARAFPVMYPTDAERIHEQLQELHVRYGDFLPAAAEHLARFLRENGIHAHVDGRQKHPYSIFQKMHDKSITHIQDLYDLFALRVIVENDAECYQALGLLHRIGHPVQNRFKDYIAFPKPNGYQSLHTTLVRIPGAPEGVLIEVQIRTHAMHREADLGLAAHWSYKEGGTAERAAYRIQLQRAFESQQPLDGRSLATRSEHIFVLTPKGDIIELPEGATPLDFAFHVHTIFGLSFRAARVNGSIVPINYTLENGDIVEIIKHRDPKPSPQWMGLLRTASARARLKRFFHTAERPLFLQLGRDAINQELAKRHRSALDPDLAILRMYDGEELSFLQREDLLVKIGQGSQSVSSVLQHLDALRDAALQRAAAATELPTASAGSGHLWDAVPEGSIPMPVRYARCCKPEEGTREPLAGVIGRSGEVRVHRSRCKLLQNVNPQRRIGVHWQRRPVRIRKKT